MVVESGRQQKERVRSQQWQQVLPYQRVINSFVAFSCVSLSVGLDAFHPKAVARHLFVGVPKTPKGIGTSPRFCKVGGPFGFRGGLPQVSALRAIVLGPLRLVQVVAERIPLGAGPLFPNWVVGNWRSRRLDFKAVGLRRRPRFILPETVARQAPYRTEDRPIAIFRGDVARTCPGPGLRRSRCTRSLF